MKHAYLIMAHNQFELLEALLRTIDDERNDIYIHIDKKCTTFDEKRILSVCKYSRVFYMQEIDVIWGDYAQIDLEFLLLKTAFKNGSYRYYHTLSGTDMPLRNQDDIHRFFEEHDGEEFLHFCTAEFNEKIRYRYERYHFFQKKLGYQKSNFGWKCVNWLCLKMQKMLGIKRNTDISFYSGASWFSITNEFAAYLIEKEEECKKRFANSDCCDEVFKQTMIMNSPFKEKVSPLGNMRMVDWTRGNPYTWQSQDWQELMESEELFARKFSANDMELVKRLEKYVTTKR